MQILLEPVSCCHVSCDGVFPRCLKGLREVKRLANILRTASFATVPDEDITCIWYKSVGKEHVAQYHQYDYVLPSYKARANRLVARDFVTRAKKKLRASEISKNYILISRAKTFAVVLRSRAYRGQKKTLPFPPVGY